MYHTVQLFSVNIFIFLAACGIVHTGHIGFFCNVGFYSHDAYTYHLANGIKSQKGHQISVMQIQVHGYHRKIPFAKSFSQYIVYDFSKERQSMDEQQLSGKLMWHTTFPFDLHNISFIGFRFLSKIQDSYSKSCERALMDKDFMAKITKLELDLLVVDYAANECALHLANMLNVTTAYVSSTPPGSDYLEYSGIPSNPAYVPVFFSNVEPYESFENRVLNLLGHVGTLMYRKSGQAAYHKMFREKAHAQFPGLDALERNIPLFATPWEMFLSAPRPMARNFRYFGCEHCLASEPLENTQFTFPQNTSGVILVSFGTTAEAEDIPVNYLQSFIKAFQFFPSYTFFWQLDMPVERFVSTVLSPLNMPMPAHVKLYRWLPLKQLLSHPKVLLLITHGGATTCLEAVYSGTPVLGIAVHSDQFHNTQRLAQSGVGRRLIVTEVPAGIVHRELATILSLHQMYKQKAMRLRAMVIDYRLFEKSASTFWIDFAARNFGGHRSMSYGRLRKFWTLRHSASWLIYYNMDHILISGCALFVLTILIVP